MNGRKLFYSAWAVGLIVAAVFVARGIARALGKPTGYGWTPGQLLVYDEESKAYHKENDGPGEYEWEYTRRGQVKILALRRSADGTIDLLRTWKRENPALTRHVLNRQDSSATIGRIFVAQVSADPVGARFERIRETGDPVDARSPDDVEKAIETVFDRSLLLPGGHIDVGDHGDWTERIGPLEAKYQWEVSGREERDGRECLVYKTTPSAVLAVKPETLPNYNSHVWRSLGADEGYVTTRGSVTTVWIADKGRVPVAMEMDQRYTIVPMKYYGLYWRTQLKWKLSKETLLTGASEKTAVQEAYDIARAEVLVNEKKPKEAIDLYRPISEAGRPDAVWQEFATARMEMVTCLLPLEGRPAPPLPEGDWTGDTPKTLEELRGRVVLVDFWLLRATPCVETMKTLKRLRSPRADRGFYVVGLTEEEPKNDAASIKNYVQQALIDYPTVIVKDGFTNPAWQANNFPYCVLIDKKGIVRWTGSPADSSLEQLIEKLLAEN